MTASLNRVLLIGNLGRDPEIRRTQDGKPIANLSLATTETWRDKNTGEKREKTEWHRVVIFSEGLCKVAEQYLRKGSKAFVEGQLQTREWEDQSGQKKYTTEVVLQNYGGNLIMLDGKSQTSLDDIPDKTPPPGALGPEKATVGGGELEDEIPF